MVICYLQVSEQAVRREKVTWLLREKEMVETDLGIRRALQAKVSIGGERGGVSPFCPPPLSPFFPT